MKTGHLWLAVFVSVGIGMIPSPARSAAPDPNGDPTGNAGALKDKAETGGGYNPHNGNGSRSIRDLSVPNMPGAYGLDFTRHWNSIDESFDPIGQPGPRAFGAGGWTHSWNWTAAPDSVTLDCEQCGPLVVTVTSIIKIDYPDGRSGRFAFSRTNLNYSGDLQDPRPYPATIPGIPGTDDHLVGMAPDGSRFTLYLADGGAVYFELIGLGYRGTKVVDPHGLATILMYDPAGRLSRVTGPDGRSLYLTWGSFGDQTPMVIRSVGWGRAPGSMLQRVDYDYQAYSFAEGVSWYALTRVTYVGDTGPDGQVIKANYTYTPWVSNGPMSASLDGRGPLLTIADDPRFDGAMTRIQYVFRGGPGGEPFCDSPNPLPAPGVPALQMAAFPVEQELNPDTGALVAKLWLPCNGTSQTGLRREYRGAGGQRLFYYGGAGGAEPGSYYTPGNNGTGYYTPPEAAAGSSSFPASKITDFADNPAAAPSEFQHHLYKPWRIFDARGTLTQFTYATALNPIDPTKNGRLKEIWYRGSENPTSKRTFDWDNSGGSAAQDFIHLPNTFHHWLFRQTDENGNTTVYTRDSLRRVTRIDYAGGASESFSYDCANSFGRPCSHTMASGAVEYFEYDGLGRLAKEWNTADGIGNGTTYTYDALDRVATMLNARGRVAGKPYSTRMEYNGRHQITKVHYPSTGGSADPTMSYEYDKYGNCTASTNELGYRSTYAYDWYRRCTAYTEQLDGSTSRTWNWIYDRYYGSTQVLASAHTSKQWRVQIEPIFNAVNERRLTAREFDYNDRITAEQTGWVTNAAGLGWYYSITDGETHYFTYDVNGNKQTATDSLGRVTVYAYDKRDRLIKTTEPLGRITEVSYDPAGNKMLVRFPDLKTQQWLDYDAFGQPGRFLDERGNTTNLAYQWGPMKKLRKVTTHRVKDNAQTENQETTFSYDGMGRPADTLFPDGSNEHTMYDGAGQLQSFKTRKNQTKTLAAADYDARGREKAHLWNDGTPRVTRDWDDAGRLKWLENIYARIDYTYDNAAQVLTESNAIAGSNGVVGAGTAPVAKVSTYTRYPNGEVKTLLYPSGTLVTRNYTARGQLQSVTWPNGSVAYAYLADGKMDFSDYGNGLRNNVDYDGRGFPGLSQTYKLAGTVNYTRRDYWRDTRDRITAWKKTETGRGDRYVYDAEGQLTSAVYNTAINTLGLPSGAADRTDAFTYDALGNRVGWNNVASRGQMYFARRDNGLNHYLSWQNNIPAPNQWGSGIFYDDNLTAPTPPWVWPGNGVTMGDGLITASYNALNQPMAIYSPALPAGSYLWLGFDPLGRCVKRWLASASGGAAATNPATYFYYDGWNMIQEGVNANAPGRVYVHGARVDEIAASCIWSGNQWAYHHYDARGHCILLTLANANIQEKYEYDAFGQPYFYNASGTPLPKVNNRPVSAWGNRFLFTGREWLGEIGLYDYRNRMYQPELGRFMQPDPKQFAAGDYNLYRYCHNDPVNKSDPTGLIFVVTGGDKDWLKKVNNDLAKVERNLAKAVKAGESGAQQKLQDFQKLKSDPNYTVKIVPQKSGAGNEYRPGQKEIAFHAYNPNGGKDASGNTNRDAFIGLGHEAGHAIDDYKGALNSGPANDPSRFPNRAEESAVEFENTLRSAQWPNDPSRQRPSY